MVGRGDSHVVALRRVARLNGGTRLFARWCGRRAMAARVPPELWTHIFSFLDHRSLLRSVVPVCREFRDIGLSANLWKRLCAKMWVLQDNAPRDNNYTRYYFDKLKWEEEWLRGSARCFTHGVSDLPVTGLRLLDGKLFLSSGDFQVSVYFRTISQLHVLITAISTYSFFSCLKKNIRFMSSMHLPHRTFFLFCRCCADIPRRSVPSTPTSWTRLRRFLMFLTSYLLLLMRFVCGTGRKANAS
jgi:hypothetical protein